MPRHQTNIVDALDGIHIAFCRGGVGAAIDEVYLLAEVRQIDRVAQRRVARADDRDLLFAEEAAVAYRAPADPASAQSVFTFDPKLSAAHAVRDDGSLRFDRFRGRGDREKPVGFCQGSHIAVFALNAQRVDLRLHVCRQLKALDLFDRRIVLDLRGQRRLSAEARFLDDNGIQSRPRGIDRRCHTGDAAADNC